MIIRMNSISRKASSREKSKMKVQRLTTSPNRDSQGQLTITSNSTEKSPTNKASWNSKRPNSKTKYKKLRNLKTYRKPTMPDSYKTRIPNSNKRRRKTPLLQKPTRNSMFKTRKLKCKSFRRNWVLMKRD